MAKVIHLDTHTQHKTRKDMVSSKAKRLAVLTSSSESVRDAM